MHYKFDYNLNFVELIKKLFSHHRWNLFTFWFPNVVDLVTKNISHRAIKSKLSFFNSFTAIKFIHPSIPQINTCVSTNLKKWLVYVMRQSSILHDGFTNVTIYNFIKWTYMIYCDGSLNCAKTEIHYYVLKCRIFSSIKLYSIRTSFLFIVSKQLRFLGVTKPSTHSYVVMVILCFRKLDPRRPLIDVCFKSLVRELFMIPWTSGHTKSNLPSHKEDPSFEL